MRRTTSAMAACCGLLALITACALFAAPTVAEAKGEPKADPVEASLIAFGAGYADPEGSARVRSIQQRLRRAGESPGPVDGRYGPLTEAAVERFQAGQGLVADGLVGPATATALRHQHDLIAFGAGYADPEGSARVRSIQQRLRRAGESPGPVDGRYGPLTEAAVERFQAGQGLVVDGVVGEATSGTLARVVAPSPERPEARAARLGAPSPDPEPAARAAAKPVNHPVPLWVENAGPNHEFPESVVAVWAPRSVIGLACGIAFALLLVGRARRSARARVQPASLLQVRILGRGGQGVVTAAELLSDAAFVEGRHGQTLPTFGFDGIGAAVSFCRIGDRPIRAREPIGPPNGVLILDPTVLHQVDLLRWTGSGCYVLINSTRSLEELGLRELAEALPSERRLTIPAVELANGHAGGSIPNASLLGGFAALSGAVSLASIESAIRERFPGPTGEANVVAAGAAYNYVEREVRTLAGGGRQLRRTGHAANGGRRRTLRSIRTPAERPRLPARAPEPLSRRR